MWKIKKSRVRAMPSDNDIYTRVVRIAIIENEFGESSHLETVRLVPRTAPAGAYEMAESETHKAILAELDRINRADEPCWACGGEFRPGEGSRTVILICDIESGRKRRLHNDCNIATIRMSYGELMEFVPGTMKRKPSAYDIKRCFYDNPEKRKREFWVDGEHVLSISLSAIGTDPIRHIDPAKRGPFVPGQIIGDREAMQPRKDNGANG